MLDIVKVVLKLFADFMHFGDMALIDLSPARDARPHDVAIEVEGNFPLIPFG